MQIFLVGGAVRDNLLGLSTAHDRDYVVTGSTREEMLRLGFRQVGHDFPVFLHPLSGEEYTLTNDLPADLKRRDITINAMAVDAAGQLIDPWGGREDLKHKVLRHTSDQFADDPLRVYRVARFQATFPDFHIAAETMELMKELVQTSAFIHLTRERILSEFKRALNSRQASAFFEVLSRLQALNVHFPQLTNLPLTPLDQWFNQTDEVALKYALLLRPLKVKQILDLSNDLGVPEKWKQAALIVGQYHQQVQNVDTLSMAEVVDFFYRLDAFRKTQNFWLLVRAGQLISGQNAAGEKLMLYFEKIRQVPFTPSTSGSQGSDIAEVIRQKRIDLLRKLSGN